MPRCSPASSAPGSRRCCLPILGVSPASPARSASAWQRCWARSRRAGFMRICSPASMNPRRCSDAHATETTGEVWLIGAGPGAEDLLTLRAQRLLAGGRRYRPRSACAGCRYRDGPPRCRTHLGRQEARAIIPSRRRRSMRCWSGLLREGKRVARLKSGDPMVFGRAGEELAALRKAGVPLSDRPRHHGRAGRGGRQRDAGDPAQDLAGLPRRHGAWRAERRTRPLGGARVIGPDPRALYGQVDRAGDGQQAAASAA